MPAMARPVAAGHDAGAHAGTAPSPLLPGGTGWAAAGKWHSLPCGQPRLAVQHNEVRQTRYRACSGENYRPFQSGVPARCRRHLRLRPSKKTHETWRSRRRNPDRQTYAKGCNSSKIIGRLFFSPAAVRSSPLSHAVTQPVQKRSRAAARTGLHCQHQLQQGNHHAPPLPANRPGSG